MPQTPEKEQRKRRPWLRYFGLSCLLLILLLAALYRPILFGIAQFAGQQFARSEHLALQFKLRGSVFTNLYIEDLTLRALPENTSFPVTNLTLGQLGLRYHPLKLLQQDWEHVVELVAVHDLDLTLRPGPAQASTAKPESTTSPGGLPKLIPLVPEKIDFRNINVHLADPTGGFDLEKLNLLLDAKQPGYLRIRRIRVPNAIDWQGIDAGLNRKGQHILLTNLQLPPYLSLASADIDLTGATGGRFDLSLLGETFGAGLRGNLGFQQTGSSNAADVHLILDRLDLAKIQPQLPLKGIIENIKLDLSGDIAQPDSFSGQVAVMGNGLQYQDKVIGILDLQTTLQQGRGTIDRGLIGTLPNRLALAGTYQLPTSLNDPLTGLAVDIGIAGWLTRPQSFLPGVRGSALLRASVHLASGMALLHLETKAAGISSQGVTLEDAQIQLLGSALVPLGSELTQDLALGTLVSARTLRWDTWHLDRLGLTAGLAENGQFKMHTDVVSGRTNLRADAQAILPNPGQELDLKTVEAHLRYHLDRLSDLTDQAFISGQVTGDGNVDLVDTHSQGRLNLQGKELGANGIRVAAINLEAEFRDQNARLKQLRVELDPNNYLNLTGSLVIEESLPFQLQGLVALGDLRGLNYFLSAQNLPADLSGRLSLNLRADGGAKPEDLRATISGAGSKIAYQGLVVRDLTIDVNLANQLLQLQHCQLQLDDRNQIDLGGQCDLRAPYPFTSNGRVALTDLSFLRPFLEANKQPGDLKGQLTADFTLHGDSSTPMQEGSLSARGAEIAYRGLKLASLNAESAVHSNEVTLQSLHLVFDPQNQISASASYRLVAPNPYHVESVVDLRDLHSFDALAKSTGKELNLSGQFNARVTADGRPDEKLPEVTFAIEGTKISAANLVVQTLQGAGSLRNDEFDLGSLRIILDSENLVDLRAHAKLADPYPFSAYGKVGFQNLAIFNPLLKEFGQDLDLAGQINLNGSGQGDLLHPQGSFEVRGDGLAAKGVQNVQLDILGSAQDSQLDLRQIEVRSPLANISATLTATPDFVEIPSLRIEQNGNVINGSLKVPLDLRPGAKLPVALDRPLRLNLDAPKISLAKIPIQLPLKGTIENVKLDLSGDIAQPESFSGQVAISGSGLQYQDKVIGNLDLQTSIHQGRGSINRGWVGTLPNRLALAGTYQLPTSLNDPLTSLAADIGIAGWLTRPDNFVPDVHGSALLRASVHLANGMASLHLDTRAAGISSQGATLDDAQIHLLGSVLVPLGPDLVQDIAAGALVSARALRWDTWHLDRFGLIAGLAENGQLRIHTDLSSGGTNLRADAQAIVPNPGQELNLKTVEAHLKYHLGPLSDLTDQTLVSGQVSGDGDVDLVDTHSQGRLSLQAKDLGANGITVPSVNLDAEFHDQDARLKQLRVDLDSNNYLSVTGSLVIEQSLPFQLKGLVALGDLQRLNHFLSAQKLPADLAGQLSLKLQANGDAKLENLRATVSAGGSKIAYQGLVVRDFKIDANVVNQVFQVQNCLLRLDDRNEIDVGGQFDLRAPYPFTSNGHLALTDLSFLRPFLEANKQPGDLTGQLTADFALHGDSAMPLQEGFLSARGAQIAYRGLKLASLDAEASVDSKTATLQSLYVVLDPQNQITASGSYSLAAPNPYHFEGVIDLRDLHSFDALAKSTGQELNLAGQLNVRLTADGRSNQNLPDVTFAAGGAKISAANLVIQTMEASGSLKGNEFDLPSLRLILDAQNLVDLRAHAKLTDPYPFSADGRVNFQNLAIFNPLLKAFGQDLGLGGQINLTGSGQGDLLHPQGSFELHGNQLAAKGVQNVRLDVVGTAQNSQLDLTQIEVRSPLANLSATLTATPDFVEIPSLRLEQKGNVINGNLKVPLDLQPGAKLPIALDRPLTLNLNAPRISIANLQPDQPQVTGNVAMNVTASGTLGKPDATVKIDLTDFRSVAAASVKAANSHLEVNLKEDMLTLNGNVSQPDIRPLQMRGQLPLSVEKILAAGQIDPQTPVQFSVNLPDTDLGFVRRLSPLVHVIQGRAAMDATLGGTIEKPVVAGQFRVNISQFKAASDVIPPLSNFLTQIDFKENRIELTQVRGLVAGGPLSAGGNIDLAKLTDPQFNLTARGQEILLTRSDNIIVRANFDLAVRGPLSAAEVAGNVGITRSRFFQDIDILPLNLPGRPPPQPPSIPPQTSIQTPPLSNWKFNIAIRTADPFLIQSNLARGRVVINLHVGGTGAKPEVTGYVRIDRFVASLPFSHMTIDNSFINFVPGGNPLDPTLNILGRSAVRDYEIRMLIYGRVSNFQILFQSTPPLPQGSIATLLATGSTPEEFAQNPSVLAGRAAFLVITQLLGKVFKTNPTEQQRSYLDRLQVDIIPGSTVGSQDIRARFSVTDNWQIIGEFGSEGNVGGRLRYLVRFR